MYDHRNFATHGLYPGLVSTFSVAILGHLELEIRIDEVPAHGNGLPHRLPTDYKKKYKITVTVRRGDRKWTKTRTVSETAAKVVAKLTKTEINRIDVDVKLTSIVNTTSNVAVNVAPPKK